MRTLLRPFPLALSMLLVQPLGAQQRESPESLKRSGGNDRSEWQFDQCMGGLTYGAPFKWALSYGMGMVRETAQHDMCLLGAAKIGFGGAGFSAGAASAMGPFGSGVAITGGVLRTFNDPMGATSKRTYYGASIHVWPLLGLGGEVGIYRRAGEDPPSVKTSRNLLVWSVGFGF